MSPGPVAVIGGGVVGLCAAEALARRGAEVVVLEAGVCGAGASAGNAGWLTPGISTPLPAPGTMAQALRWMLRPSSPLLVRPRLDPAFARWALAFWRNTARRRYLAGMAALVALSDRALPAFDALAAAGVEFEMHADGLLFVALDERALEAERRALDDQRAAGYRGRYEVLDRVALHALEPALAGGVAGGILARDERHVRPETLTHGLVSHLRARGVEVREQAPVASLARRGGGWRVATAGGDAVEASRVVVATGADTGLLARLGTALPMQGAKGYSVTEESPAARPGRPLYLLEAKVGVSPFAGGVRLAGTLELGSRDAGLDRRRLRALDDAGARYLRGWQPRNGRAAWAGSRPLLPDGLPAIGPVPGQPGLFVATGHALLGVTLAAATGEVLAPAVLGEPPPLDLAPFSAARFGR